MASAAAVALAAGMTSAPASAQERGAAARGGSEQGSRGAEKTWITLITGDRVAVDAAGQPVALERGKGREHIPVQIQRVNGHVYAVPLDAQRLIGSGRVDQRLFDLTTLSKPEYRERMSSGLRLVVMYRGERPAARAALREAGNAEVRRTFPRLNADAVSTTHQDAGAVWDALTSEAKGAPFRNAASGVAAVWLDGIRKANLDKSVPQIGAPEAWKAGFDGKGTKIAVLDTGVDQTHPDLAGQEIAEKNFSQAADAKDRVGHGTHVASIAAGTGAKSKGKYKGVAPGAKILDGKVLDDGGSGGDSEILAGMEWAAAEKADVVNLSLGGPDSPGDDPLEAAVNKLSASTGTLFVISAGNEGPGAGSVGSPGSADAALTVGAVDKKDKLADFSSIGPRVGDGALKPDVTAPGVDIGAAAAPGSLIAEEGDPVAPGYVSISGTSMAAPHAAGGAAILAQQHPDWTGAQIKAALAGSTVPGKGYTAFQEGSGRIDLRKATKQSVIAKEVSLSFGKQLWPHTDDKPVTKQLTYRNLGGTPVTLDLAVTAAAPNGKPAPDGFFSLDKKQLTIAPGAEASVAVTSDTRLGGTVDGAYSAVVTATGGGQSVRTAAAVEREVESYDVTLKHLGRDGKPAKVFGSYLDGVGGLGTEVFQYVDDTTTPRDGKLRLPKGRYVLSGSIHDRAADGADWINQPRLDVTKNVTVTLDARKAKPIKITPPDKKATSEFASINMTVSGKGFSTGFGWWLNDYKGFRTAHQGPALGRDELSQHIGQTLRRGATEYHLAFGGPTTKVATGFVRKVKAGDLAKVTAKLGASVSGRWGYLTPFPHLGGEGGGSAVAFERKLPSTATLYLTATGGVKWAFNFEQIARSDDETRFETSYGTEPLAFKAGRAYTKNFNVGVFGPALGKEFGVFRKGDTLTPMIPLFADGQGNPGGSLFDIARTTLRRDGKVIGTNGDPLTGEKTFTVPSGQGSYKLSTSVHRSKVAKVSTKITADWTFSSQKVSAKTRLPISVVRFTPALAVDSTAKAGATVKVPVAVHGAAAGKNLKSLTVYVSYDDGKSWKKLAVNGGKVTVKNPKAGKSVSFKAVAADKKGNTVTQAIHRAYLTK
ncbi:S8 family serine peptidase [Streptomyces sp. LX-29]|uniref:S8 family serine peptidase n=1 Tax=Streptomyces sp. LX-29 TaxID=2900152 RepID=UPI00321C0471